MSGVAPWLVGLAVWAACLIGSFGAVLAVDVVRRRDEVHWSVWAPVLLWLIGPPVFNAHRYLPTTGWVHGSPGLGRYEYTVTAVGLILFGLLSVPSFCAVALALARALRPGPGSASENGHPTLGGLFALAGLGALFGLAVLDDALHPSLVLFGPQLVGAMFVVYGLGWLRPGTRVDRARATSQRLLALAAISLLLFLCALSLPTAAELGGCEALELEEEPSARALFYGAGLIAVGGLFWVGGAAVRFHLWIPPVLGGLLAASTWMPRSAVEVPRWSDLVGQPSARCVPWPNAVRWLQHEAADSPADGLEWRWDSAVAVEAGRRSLWLRTTPDRPEKTAVVEVSRCGEGFCIDDSAPLDVMATHARLSALEGHGAVVVVPAGMTMQQLVSVCASLPEHQVCWVRVPANLAP
jgi:hypothetical protein